jgi:hypothetical protein
MSSERPARRLVLIEAKSELYSFYAEGRFVAQYRAESPLDAETVEHLRANHPIPKERA